MKKQNQTTPLSCLMTILIVIGVFIAMGAFGIILAMWLLPTTHLTSHNSLQFIGSILGAPKGIRIPVYTLKGCCPRPLDDGGADT